MSNGRFFQSWTQNIGRDGWDQPQAIPDSQTAESYNIELRQGGLGRKRSGSDKVSLTYSAGSGLDSRQLAKFIPGNVLSSAELWIVSLISGSNYGLYRLPGDASSAVLLSSTLALPASFAQLNGKFFIASALSGGVNRLQVYAPAESTTTIRYAGLKPEAAPTAADYGSGTYANTPRTYRVVTRRIVGGVIVSQSEPSATVSITPSGIGEGITVTKASVSGEGETHWCVQAAAADLVYWEISSNIPIATTTYNDTVDPSSYPSIGLTPDLIGSHTPFPSVQYLLSDGNRLFGLGVYATAAGDSLAPVAGRMYFTPVLGSSDTGDDERILNTVNAEGWIDLAIGGGGVDRGLAGPINNAIVAFQRDGVFFFIPTGNPDTPYRRIVVSTSVGSMSGASVVMAEDEAGQPALYFLDPKNGPYRTGGQGYSLTWIGKDVKDLWNNVNIASTTPEVDYIGTYDTARKLIVWHVASTAGTAAADTIVIVFDVTNGRFVGADVRQGWTQWSPVADAASTGKVSASVMFPSTLATPRSSVQALHYGISSASGPAVVYRVNQTATLDGTAAYRAYVRSRAWRWSPMGRLKKLLEAVVIAKTRAATSIRARFIGNWGVNETSQTISLAPSGSETYVRPRPNPVDFTDLMTVQMEVGDATAVDNSWEVESCEVQVEHMSEAR